jgi:hypothetical protein
MCNEDGPQQPTAILSAAVPTSYDMLAKDVRNVGGCLVCVRKYSEYVGEDTKDELK